MEVPSASVFRAVLSGDFKSLLHVKESDIVPFLPALVRFALCCSPPQQTSGSWTNARIVAHKIISEIEAANQIAAYLDVDFKEIEVDALKLRRLKDKMSQSGDSSGSRVHNVLVSSLQFGLIVEFERADTTRKFRLLISELLRIMDQVTCALNMKTVISYFVRVSNAKKSISSKSNCCNMLGYLSLEYRCSSSKFHSLLGV